MDKKIEQTEDVEEVNEYSNYHDKNRFVRTRRKIIKTLLFATILGYSCGGSNIYYELKYQPYARLKRERAKISQDPTPKTISNAHQNAIGKIFGFTRDGYRFDAFKVAFDNCIQNSECKIQNFPAKEILDPEEYTLNPGGQSARLDGHNYFLGEFSTTEGNALIIIFRIIEIEHFFGIEEHFIAKPFLVGGAKPGDNETMIDLIKKARLNAKKNMHDSYMMEYGPRILIIDNGLGGDQRTQVPDKKKTD